MAAENAGCYPEQWGKWCRAVRDNKVAASAELNRFAARYRAARLFHGIHCEPTKGRTWEQGFSALLKVFLAYTAVESLVKGLSACHQVFPLNDVMIEDLKIAGCLRKNRKLVNLLIAEIDAKPLIRKLNSFVNSESSDVFCVASAIRHLVAHGTITTGGADVRAIHSRRCLLDLADAVLTVCDVKFSDFCSKQLHTS